MCNGLTMKRYRFSQKKLEFFPKGGGLAKKKI
jgi:hypothetical protein